MKIKVLKKIQVIAILVFITTLTITSYAQEVKSEEFSPSVNLSGSISMYLDTYIKSAPNYKGIEGLESASVTGMPSFVFSGASLEISASILPWLNGNMEIETDGISTASLTAKVLSNYLSIKAGWFDPGTSYGSNLMGLKFHGNALNEQLHYGVFVGNGTTSRPSSSSHFLKSVRTGLTIQYDVLQPWRGSKEIFHKDTNFSISTNLEYSPLLLSSAPDKATQDAAKNSSIAATELAIGPKMNYIAFGGNFNATFSIITMNIYGKARMADAPSLKGDKLEEYPIMYELGTNVIGTIYNNNNFAFTGKLKFKYINNKPSTSNFENSGKGADGTDRPNVGLKGQHRDKIMRLSVGFPIYFKQGAWIINPEMIFDISRKTEKGTETISGHDDKAMVFRLSSSLSF